MENTIKKYIDRLNTLKENRAQTSDTNNDAQNELYDRLINQVAEFIRDIKSETCSEILSHSEKELKENKCEYCKKPIN